MNTFGKDLFSAVGEVPCFILNSFFFSDYDSFLIYSRVLRLDSIHISDESNLNAPFPSIESKEYMRNSIALAYDYSRKLIFYSDIERGSINSVHFNGTNHTVLIESKWIDFFLALIPFLQYINLS